MYNDCWYLNYFNKYIKSHLQTNGTDDWFSSSFVCWFFGKLLGSVSTSNGTDGCWYVAGSYKFHGIVCPNVPFVKIR